MFGLVSEIKYNQLDKKYASTQKELDDIKKNCVMVRKSDMDVLMADMKKLEEDNRMLLKRLEEYENVIDKMRRLSNTPLYTSTEYKGLDTDAYWVTEEGKPLVCSKCGYSFWNGTDQYVTHCSGCGRRMINIVQGKINEE